ncbi:2OG-Fe(II) oxygenase, partial [Delftia sp.]|uniref:2OG-Fe(II) oxygenase n=1 Tax=Delftia sp. TaxID=1886637 RepID=UPI00259C8550
MARHGFGSEYRHFDYPLPPLLQRLREQLYSRLVPVANRWNQRMGLDVRYPDRLQDFLARCHAHGLSRGPRSSNTARATTTACTRM